MPVASLFDHLEKGATIDQFLEWFPDMNATDVHEVLRFARASLRVPEKAAGRFCSITVCLGAFPVI